jgi:hypothetical protein
MGWATPPTGTSVVTTWPWQTHVGILGCVLAV